jgi:hypothetical protein
MAAAVVAVQHRRGAKAPRFSHVAGRPAAVENRAIVNELIAGPAPRDPLLGWAGLDAAGRIVSLGGRLAPDVSGGVAPACAVAVRTGRIPRLQIGTRLLDALRDSGSVEQFIARTVADGPSGGPRVHRCRIVWAHPSAGAAGVDAGRAPADATGEPSRGDAEVDLLLRCAFPRSGPVRFAAEFHVAPAAGVVSGPAEQPPLAPPPIATANPEAADIWRLGSALYSATVVPAASRPVGLIRFALHPVALPRLAAVDDLDPWIAVSLARLAASAARLGIEAVAARTGTRELTVWVRDGSGCMTLCEHWLSAMSATPLVGTQCRLVVGPSAAWCVMPADGTVLGHLLDALDAVYQPADLRPARAPIPVSSFARERDLDERRDALTGTLVELAASGRARLAGEPVIDAPTGLPVGTHLRAEFRSLFALADLIDYLPDIVEDDGAADALNIWLAAAIRTTPLAMDGQAPNLLQMRVSPSQLRRIDTLGPVIAALKAAGGGTAPCLMLPEAALHRDAYGVIDAAAAAGALGATIGIDDYRGLLPPAQLVQAGVGALRLHRALGRELGERAFAGARLCDLLSRARASGLSVLVTGLAHHTAVAAAGAAGALQLSGPVFGRIRRFVARPH